ncbi:hypothetical protein [Qingshengfaniella alkalisoli]|uniref:hypothetical protein n=1 Tax=Qingshengfaniella alkalisoli TaxID=2599296 RepID=UPI003B845F91
MVSLAVHNADGQDRDGASELLKSITITYPMLRHVSADGGYAGSDCEGPLSKSGDGRCRSSNAPILHKAFKSS